MRAFSSRKICSDAMLRHVKLDVVHIRAVFGVTCWAWPVLKSASQASPNNVMNGELSASSNFMDLSRAPRIQYLVP